MTHRERIRQADVEVKRLEQELQTARDVYWQAVTDAAHDGASWRALGEEIGMAPATVLRHVGHKGSHGRPSVLDLAAAKRPRKAGTR